MVGRDVEALEVVVVELDFRPLDDLEAEGYGEFKTLFGGQERSDRGVAT